MLGLIVSILGIASCALFIVWLFTEWYFKSNRR